MPCKKFLFYPDGVIMFYYSFEFQGAKIGLSKNDKHVGATGCLSASVDQENTGPPVADPCHPCTNFYV